MINETFFFPLKVFARFDVDSVATNPEPITTMFLAV